MALVNAYTTTAAVRTHFEDGASQLSTELLERAINAASRSVDRWCGRRFWQDSAVATRTYPAYSPTRVLVDDISTRTGLVVATGVDGVSFGTTWTAGTDFILEPRNADKVGGTDTADPHAFWQLVSIGREWPRYGDISTIQVTARFGWSSCPAEVEQATILKAAQLFKRKDAPFGVAGFGEFGAVRITRNDPDVIDLLSPHRRSRVA